jgi:RimJ/RimL family protein N-acetyltransferase
MKYLEEREKTKDPDDYGFSIFIKENDKIVGNCGVHKSNNKNFPDETFIGIIVGEKDEWGKGYGSDAIRTLLKFIKENMDVKEVYLNVDIPNVAAQKCYKKCGFEMVGTYDAPERINSDGKQYVMKYKL